MIFQPATSKELDLAIRNGIECDISLIANMEYKFSDSTFDGDISQWNVSSVTNMNWIFAGSEFNGDISRWKINEKCDTANMMP